MADSLKVIPWCDWGEWSNVYNSLYSDCNNDRYVALLRVAAWRSRCKLPVAIDATAQLIDLQLKDNKQSSHVTCTGDRSWMELRLAYSMAVLRTVNGIVDSGQKGEYAAPVSAIAAGMGLPTWLVDIRHDSTHNDLPSLPALRLAAGQLLEWLKSNFWEAQRRKFGDIAVRGASLLQCFMEMREEEASNEDKIVLKRASRGKADTGALDLVSPAVTKCINQIIQAFASPHAVRDTLLPHLIQSHGSPVFHTLSEGDADTAQPALSLLVPPRDDAGFGCNSDGINKWRDRVRPLLLGLQRAWDPFTSVLLEGLVRGLATGGGELDAWEAARARTWDREAEAAAEAAAGSGKKKKKQQQVGEASAGAGDNKAAGRHNVKGRRRKGKIRGGGGGGGGGGG